MTSNGMTSKYPIVLISVTSHTDPKKFLNFKIPENNRYDNNRDFIK